MARARPPDRRQLIALRGLHREVRTAAESSVRVGAAQGLHIRISSAFRSMDQQRRLRVRFEKCVAANRFPSPPDCLYPANRPGDSGHNFGLAWDSVVPPGEQDAWDAVRTAHGFKVLPNDRIHAEVPDWRSHKSGDIRWTLT